MQLNQTVTPNVHQRELQSPSTAESPKQDLFEDVRRALGEVQLLQQRKRYRKSWRVPKSAGFLVGGASVAEDLVSESNGDI
jgi:hypothetical protein